MWLQFGGICSSVGLGFFCSNACARIIIAGDAVAALRRLLLHEGALDRRGRFDRAEPSSVVTCLPSSKSSASRGQDGVASTIP